MNLSLVEQIAKAVLYEGYMLYPYRPSSVKNRQRWNFGVLYPEAYSEAQAGADACSMQTECLVYGTVRTKLELRLRFLQLQLRGTRRAGDTADHPLSDAWQEAVERDVSIAAFPLETALFGSIRRAFRFPPQTLVTSEPNTSGKLVRRQAAIRGDIAITAEKIRVDLHRIKIRVRNTAPLVANGAARDEALLQSLVSAHIVLGVEVGEFVSLLEPESHFQEFAAQCQNVGVWPVLVGEPGQRDTMLASPIILYDYPQIAPESAGDLFDGTEIDEILSLRILTLTDAEKQEIRQSDERVRHILERTESMPAEQFMKLHGAVRGMRPLKETTP
jgi:hydrogenase maturation protease